MRLFGVLLTSNFLQVPKCTSEAANHCNSKGLRLRAELFGRICKAVATSAAVRQR